MIQRSTSIRQRLRRAGAVLLLTVVAGWVGVACQPEDLNRTFDGPYFVRFTDTTLTYKESYSPIIGIRVHNAGPIRNEPITVTYTVSGSARETRDYVIGDTKGTVIIPAGKSFGTINIRLINNANNLLEARTLTFTLTGVQPSPLQVGFGPNNALGRQLRFTIQGDCLLGGNYTGSARVGAQTATVPNVAITSADCKLYTVSNWNIGSPLFSLDAYRPTLRFIDVGDNSLTIPPQTNDYLNTTDTLRGTGAWNPRDRRITLNLQIKLRLTNNRDTTLFYTQTYTPQ